MTKRFNYKVQGRDEHYKIWHTSKKYMLIYFHSDGGDIVTSERMYPIRRKALAFVGMGKYHYTMPTDTEKYVRSKIFLTEEELGKVKQLFADGDITHAFSGAEIIYAELGDEAAEICEAALYELSSHTESERGYIALLLFATARLVLLLDENAGKSTYVKSDGMRAVIDYVNKWLSEDLTVEKLAAVAHLSKYHFSRVFKDRVGTTVMSYLIKTRITRAKDLLRMSEKSITDISLECGFPSVSYFSRKFKEETGVSPREYRRDK